MKPDWAVKRQTKLSIDKLEIKKRSNNILMLLTHKTMSCELTINSRICFLSSMFISYNHKLKPSSSQKSKSQNRSHICVTKSVFCTHIIHNMQPRSCNIKDDMALHRWRLTAQCIFLIESNNELVRTMYKTWPNRCWESLAKRYWGLKKKKFRWVSKEIEQGRLLASSQLDKPHQAQEIS